MNDDKHGRCTGKQRWMGRERHGTQGADVDRSRDVEAERRNSIKCMSYSVERGRDSNYYQYCIAQDTSLLSGVFPQAKRGNRQHHSNASHPSAKEKSLCFAPTPKSPIIPSKVRRSIDALRVMVLLQVGLEGIHRPSRTPASSLLMSSIISRAATSVSHQPIIIISVLLASPDTPRYESQTGEDDRSADPDHHADDGLLCLWAHGRGVCLAVGEGGGVGGYG
jgi:hypothetical protein